MDLNQTAMAADRVLRLSPAWAYLP